MTYATSPEELKLLIEGVTSGTRQQDAYKSLRPSK